MIKHIVCHKYTDRSQAPIIAKKLRALVGADFMGSPRSFDLALVATLEDRAALDVYADHPAHVAVKEYIHQYLEKGISVDFEVE